MDNATGDQYIVDHGDAWPDYTNTTPAPYRNFTAANPYFRGAPLVPQYGESRPNMRGEVRYDIPYTHPALFPSGPQRPVAPYYGPQWNSPIRPVAMPEKDLDQWERLYRWGQLGVPAQIVTTAAPVPASPLVSSAFSPSVIALILFFFVVLVFLCLLCSRRLGDIGHRLDNIGRGQWTGGSDCGCSCKK